MIASLRSQLVRPKVDRAVAGNLQEWQLCQQVVAPEDPIGNDAGGPHICELGAGWQTRRRCRPALEQGVCRSQFMPNVGTFECPVRHRRLHA